MTERENRTPERPTPRAIFQSMQAERGELSMPEYIKVLRGKYMNSRTIAQAREVRNGYRSMPWIGADPQDARTIRTTFLDGFVVGHHVARRSIPESAAKRAGMADAFNSLMASILNEIDPEGKSGTEVNAIVIASLQSFVDAADDYEPEYGRQFTTIAPELTANPDHQQYARFGYGIAVGLGIAVQDAIVDPDSGA